MVIKFTFHNHNTVIFIYLEINVQHTNNEIGYQRVQRNYLVIDGKNLIIYLLFGF